MCVVKSVIHVCSHFLSNIFILELGFRVTQKLSLIYVHESRNDLDTRKLFKNPYKLMQMGLISQGS